MYTCEQPPVVYLVYLVFVGAIAVSRSEYLGCYADQASPRNLAGYFEDFPVTLTPQLCMDTCRDRGYPYAGLQYSSQCFCGDQKPIASDKKPESECSSKCSGDKSQNCGGYWRNSLYDSGFRITSHSEYLGCYVDQASPRKLTGDFEDFPVSLTPQVCTNACRDKGYVYAGLQYSSQCFCGDQRPSVSDKRPESECSKKCSGDRSHNCGGYWRNSVYSSGFTDALISDSKYEYLGCFIDQEARELGGHFQDMGSDNSPEVCVILCKTKGFAYAGLQYRTQCFCGDQDPRPERRVDQHECAKKCPGDKRYNCGASWRQNVYKTGKTAENSSNYLGCYMDEHPTRRLISDFKAFGISLTQQKCIDYCKGKGYLFAGVQSSIQCFCGDLQPSTHDLRPESECNTSCSGDQSQMCGGSWRNSIYKTGFTDSLIIDRRYEYVGCFVDQEPRSLSGYITNMGDNNSPEKCIALCKQKGYLYAGLQYRFQCLCGDEHPVPAKQADEKDCNYKCTGDNRYNCGGDWRNNIYKTGNSDSLVSDSRYQYLGCYVDQEPRELRRPLQDFGNQNSPERCITSCKEEGYVYAGLQFMTQCFCGNEDPKPEKQAVADDCNFKCPGDNRYYCGGTWRNTVYKTGHPGALATLEVEGYDYLGCYRDQEPRLLTGEMFDYPETLTPSLCVGICKNRGYLYAGLQFSRQCFCGNNEITDSYEADEADCQMKCVGNGSTICGGVSRLALYRTGNAAPIVAKLPGNEYMGCYRDQASPRLLQGHMQDFFKILTPQLCVAFCKRKGYIYAGLQSSSQCFCGDEELPSSAKVSDSDCSAECTGDKLVLCGGSWRNTVYKTGNSGSSVANIGYMYMGCYKNISNPSKLNGFMADYPQTLTPQHCVTVCKQKGFKFAGLQAGFQCFCGNEVPSDTDRKPETECNSKCSGDLTAICGDTRRNTIYSTDKSSDNEVENVCITSVTRVNGKAACQNEVVFEDNFDSLSPEKWNHIIQIGNEPDYEFVIFNSDPANAYTEDGKLVIKPTLLPDTEIRNGYLHLENCTGNPDKHECEYKAKLYAILPPVKSARLTTRKSFSFQYGKVEISAKLPAGDWLVPEIWLEPKNEVYGPGYASGRVRIAMSRGNSDLKLDGHDIGSKQLESGVLMGVGDNIRGRTIIRETSDGWHNDYHNYSVIWTPENILFMIDGEQPRSVLPNEEQPLSYLIGFTPVTPIWSSASKIAPFDNEFYLSLGVSVGDVRNFPDNVINSGKPKPWKNLELEAMFNFWRDKDSWASTWHNDTALLRVDHIKVTSL